MQLTVMATADVHLGMKFASYGEVQQELIDARFASLTEIVRLANDSACDLLVVAGDLFDRVRVALEIVEKAAAILSEFDGAATVVLPGNHDYLAPDGDTLWSFFGKAAGDRTVVLEHPQCYPLDRFDLAVDLLAAPCDSKHASQNRLSWMASYQPESAGRVAVGVAHGSVDGLTLDAEGRYFPMSQGELSNLPPRFWIVGHTHRSHFIEEPRLIVPGTPEPDGFDFAGAGSAALIHHSNSGEAVDFLEPGNYRFQDITIDVDSDGDIVSQIDQHMSGKNTLARVSIRGLVDGDAMARYRDARQRWESEAFYLRIDDSELRQKLTQQDIDDSHPQGSFAHRLLSGLVAEDDHEAIGEAIAILEELVR